uniref:Uncharacterized protein n=1 Tax=Corvus moneduloides TaxID=1196302 RepID=A0A8C3DP23_CORMO
MRTRQELPSSSPSNPLPIPSCPHSSLNIFQSDAAERKAGSTSRRLLNPAKNSVHLVNKAQGLPGLGKDFMTKGQRLSNFDSANSSVNRYFVKSGQDFSLPPLFLQKSILWTARGEILRLLFQTAKKKEPIKSLSTDTQDLKLLFP